MLPWGSIQDVLRIHITEEFRDSTSFTTLHYSSDNYIWVTPGTHFYLCNIASLDNNFSGSYVKQTSLGLNKVDLNAFNIFPNPASKYLDLNLNTNAGEALVKITDVTGKIVSSEMTAANASRIDVSFLDRGCYFVTVEADNKVYTKRFIKQ
jgi:hypothetical protein